MTHHKIIFGDARDMHEISDNTIQMAVTSPPYYNAPFDYPDLFPSYQDYLNLIYNVGEELYRVLEYGRIACFVVQDVRINKKLYPVVSDIINVMKKAGFNYKERIIWRKPEGYIRISRRSGVLLQHPYPMYFYPDNIYEDIVIFQKGEYNHQNIRRKIDEKVFEKSRVNVARFQREKWYLSVWEIALSNNFSRLIPYSLLNLYSLRFLCQIYK